MAAKKRRGGAGAERESRRDTPIRVALRSASDLHREVQVGLALGSDGSGALHDGVREAFADSLNLEAAMKPAHPSDSQWDYVLGHAESGALVALEVHPATGAEVDKVIDKKRCAQRQLAPHLSPGKKVERWLWAASGKADFVPLDRAIRKLDESGIVFAGRLVLAKHVKLGA